MASTDYGNVEEGVSQTKEVTRKSRRFADVMGAGWYIHPESGERALVQDDPLWGNTQAQAFVRLGFKFEREAEPGEIKTLPELAMDTRKEQEGSLKGLEARLERLEGVADENKELKAEVEALRKEKAEREESDRQAAEKAKADEAAKAKAADEAKTKEAEDKKKADEAAKAGQNGGNGKDNK